MRRVVIQYRLGSPLTTSGQEVGARASRKADLANINLDDPVAMRLHRDALLGLFNTPKAAQVDRLFGRALDLDELSSSWHCRAFGTADAARSLDAFVRLRGDIAHRKKGLRRVPKKYVQDHVLLIERLAILSANRVRRWLIEALGIPPADWDEVSWSAVA
jgi:hypothetical protein